MFNFNIVVDKGKLTFGVCPLVVSRGTAAMKTLLAEAEGERLVLQIILETFDVRKPDVGGFELGR